MLMPSPAASSSSSLTWSWWSWVKAAWRSRWVVLVASLWIQACAGIGYAFGSYSPLLKSSLGYSQQQINLLGNAKDIGDSLGLISGSLCEILPIWTLLLIGSFQNILGYGWLWLIVTDRLPAMPFYMICALIFVGTNGETYFNTAALVTNVRNFPKSRGQIVGLLKGFTGLCGAIFTQIYTTFFYPNQAAYLFIVAVGPVMVVCCVMFIIRPLEGIPPDNTRSESIGFSFMYGNCLVLAAYLMGVLIVQDIVDVSFTVSLIFTLLLLLLVFLPLVTPLVSWYVRSWMPKVDSSTASSNNVKKEMEAPLLNTTQQSTSLSDALDHERNDACLLQPLSQETNFRMVDFSELEDEKGSEIDELPEPLKIKKINELRNRIVYAAAEGAVRVRRRRPRRGEDFTLCEALVKADFWLLFWALVCGAGTGLTAIDNMGQLSESQGYSNVNVFVSMMSIWNYVGRLLGGYASEVIARGYAFPRPLTIVVAQVLMTVGHFIFAMGWPGTLYVGTLLVGLGYGSHWGIVPAVVSELFGMRYFGILYNFYLMASPLGSIFFSGFLAGYLYDLEAANQQTSDVSTSECYGAVCFRLTFLIMSGVCILGTALTAALCIRTRPVYKMLYGKQVTAVRA